MKRAEASRIAAERRAFASTKRAEGWTWVAIGIVLGVTPGRACQLVRGKRRRAGNPQSGVRVRETRTISEWLRERVRAVDECCAAHGAMR